MIEKKTWKEFLENFDFSNWKLNCFLNKDTDIIGIIKKFNTNDIVNNSDLNIDLEKHIIEVGIPTEIIDFENVIDFYIVFCWDFRKMCYVAWCECFFSLEEAEKFVKGDII